MALARTIGIERLPIAALMSEFVWGLTGKLLALGLLASLFYVLYRYAPCPYIVSKGPNRSITERDGSFRTRSLGLQLVCSLRSRNSYLVWRVGWFDVFFFWLYYASLVFVLWGEMGFAYEQTRLRGVRPRWTSTASTEELVIEGRFIEIWFPSPERSFYALKQGT